VANTVFLVRRPAAGASAGQDAVRQCAARFQASFRARVHDSPSVTGEKAQRDARQALLRLNVWRRAELQLGHADAGPKAQQKSVAARSARRLGVPLVKAGESE